MRELLTLCGLCSDAKLMVWSRTEATASNFRAKMQARGWKDVSSVQDPSGLSGCDIVITSTPSEQPLLMCSAHSTQPHCFDPLSQTYC